MATAAGSRRANPPKGLPPTRPQTSGPDPAGSIGLHAAAAALQRQVGNRATSLLLTRSQGQRRADCAPSQPALPVQRHSSWEHTLLGDTPPGQLGQAAVTNEARKHVLAQLWARMKFFQDDPRGNPTSLFPDVRWIQLRGSGLWVSNGELNALGDYLPDPTAYDTLPAEQMIPVLQRMRGGVMGTAGAEFGLHDDTMAGEATDWMPGAAGEVRALDKATAGLGTNRYAGLVARNACHFAPFSWQRWAEYHNDATAEALLHYQAGKAVAALSVVDVSTEEHERQALLKNGYADHFLEDSFAAGHLVNKTLVMQWFVDYLNSMSWIDRPWVGMPDDDVMARMGSAQQPGISGQDRYGQMPSEMPSSEDRDLGTRPTDPQSAQERSDYEARMAGSGVSGIGAEKAKNYQAYLKFLNSAFLQLSAGAVHDWFNERGLTVVNSEGTEMQVGGDDTLLAKSSEVGAETAARAAEMSRQAVDDLMATGATDKTVEAIMALVPQQVKIELLDGSTQLLGLADFQTEVIRPVCYEIIFPDLCGSLKGEAVRMFGAEMVSGGISVDTGSPGPGPVGDYVIPAGSPAMG